MTALRRAGPIVPLLLAALVASLFIAVIVARERGVPVRPTPFQGTHGANRDDHLPSGRSPVVYGAGLTRVVPSPVARLRGVLGNEWRELSKPLGRLLVSPAGVHSSYFQIGMVAVAPDGPARVEILTSQEQRAITSVGHGAFQVVTFGPLLAPQRGKIGAALASVQSTGPGPGAKLLLSPIEAEYLAPGQAVMRMPALAEVGPNGTRGLFISSGAVARFAMAPGITGPCVVKVFGVQPTSEVRIVATVDGETRSLRVDHSASEVRIGPFSHPGKVLSLNVVGAPAQRVFLTDLRFATAESAANAP